MTRQQNQFPSTLAYSIEKEFFLYKLKKAQKEFQRCQRKKQEFEEKHVCEKSPYIIHDFHPHNPHQGCTKFVCKFCFQESPGTIFKPSVYSFKGRTFEFKPRNRRKRQPPRRYEC